MPTGGGDMRVGVLALQGGVIEHIRHVEALGAKAVPVKYKEELAEIDRLILPGGESTAIGLLLKKSGLVEGIIDFARQGKPVWGTCAGMILLAKEIAGETENHLGLMDITVQRNAYGSQLESFRIETVIPAVSSTPVPLVFIRAPYIVKTGPGVDVLLTLDGKIVAARQKNLLATSFHPELTDDLRLHRYFLGM